MSQTKEQILTEQKFLAIAKQVKSLQDQITRLVTLLDSAEFKAIETLLKEGGNANKINGIPVSETREPQGVLVYDNNTNTYVTKRI